MTSRPFISILLLLTCLTSMATAVAAQDYNLPALGESDSSSSTPAKQHSGSNYNLPALGEPANATLSPAEEQRLGTRAFSQLLQAGQFVEDDELHHYLRQVGARLLGPTSHDVDDFHFFVANNPDINAFALPGGYVAVNAGLITATDNESELASVMAHEITHVTQRHIARQMQATKGKQWITLGALLAAAIAAGGDGDAIEAAITGGLSAMYQQQVSYTRAHESEADRIGIRMLAAAHFNPKAMAAFFETMQRNARLYGRQLPQILLTHPVNNTRIAEARSRAEDYPNPTVAESPDYAIMKERTRVLTSTQHNDLLEYYQKLGAPENTSPAQDYGYALTLTRVGRAKQAIPILRQLVANAPRQVHYQTALARAQITSGQTQAALKTLDAAVQQFSHAPAVILDYASALIDNGQSDAARAFLANRADFSDNNYHAQELLERIARKQGHLGEAYYRRALYQRLRGAYVPAIRQLRTALRRKDLDQINRDRLDALLGQMISQCKDAWPNGKCRRLVLDQRHQGNYAPGAPSPGLRPLGARGLLY